GWSAYASRPSRPRWSARSDQAGRRPLGRARCGKGRRALTRVGGGSQSAARTKGAHWMRRWKPAATGLPLAVVLAWLLMPAAAQERTPSTTRMGTIPNVSQAGKVDWPLHNFDLFNGRYSPANEINPSNAGSLVLKWSFDVQAPESIGQITPLVVDGVM